MKLYDNDACRDEFMEAVYNLLSGDSSNDRANQVIDLFDAAPAVEAEPAPLNDPLTLEQLQEMDGEPVWTVTIGLEGSGRWELCSCETITACPLHKVLRCVTSTGEATDYEFETYGKTWVVYRRKLEV